MIHILKTELSSELKKGKKGENQRNNETIKELHGKIDKEKKRMQIIEQENYDENKNKNAEKFLRDKITSKGKNKLKKDKLAYEKEEKRQSEYTESFFAYKDGYIGYGRSKYTKKQNKNIKKLLTEFLKEKDNSFICVIYFERKDQNTKNEHFYIKGRFAIADVNNVGNFEEKCISIYIIDFIKWKGSKNSILKKA